MIGCWDNCLETGEWTDSKIDPGTGQPTNKKDLLNGLLLEGLMILGDTDGDGHLSPNEVESVQEKIRKGVGPHNGPKTPPAGD